MADTPMTRDELEKAFWLSHCPVDNVLIDYVYETYYDGPKASYCTNQDAWEQTRKLASFFEEHRRLPDSLDEWMPGWTQEA